MLGQEGDVGNSTNDSGRDSPEDNQGYNKRRGSRVPNYTLPPHHAQVRPNHLSGIETDVPWGHVERQVMSNCSEVSIIISPKISCILKAEHTRLVRQLRIRLPVELNKHGGHQFGIALAVLLLELFDFRG